MRRHIPGLHSLQQNPESNLDGLFLVRVERAAYRWHRQKSFLELRFTVLEPKALAARAFSGRLYCTTEPFGNSIGFFATSGMTQNSSAATKWTRNLCSTYKGSFAPPKPP